ncbi:MAG: YesU family protein [Lentisphaerales bacterium]|nr:YesU family protein [Lentisphaerales bacterium]
MKHIFTFLILLTYIQAETVVQEYTFDDNQLDQDWHIEGPGKANVKGSKLILEPEFYEDMKALMNDGTISEANLQEEYASHLTKAFQTKGYDLDKYSITREGQSIFRGGHFNIWNKHKHPGDFAIEFDFKSLSPASLQMIMFCGNSLKYKDIFTNNSRVGLAQEIMYGDMTQYRISYFHPQRKTANMRRAPGRQMVAQGKDIASLAPGKVNKCRIERRGDKVKYFVNGKLSFEYTDKKPLKGGYWGFRLMVCAKGEYDNIKIIKL